MRKLITIGTAGAGVLVTGAILAAGAVLPLTGAAIAVLTRPQRQNGR